MKKRSCPFLILYYWAKIIGINPSTLTANNDIKYSYCGLCYGFILCAFNSYLSYRVLSERYDLWLPGDTPIGIIVDYIALICGFLDSTCTWLISGFHQNRVKLIIQNFAKARKTSEKLGIYQDYDGYFKKIGFCSMVLHILYILWMTINGFTMRNFPNVSTLTWSWFSIVRLSSFNAVMLVFWSFMIVKHGFRQLNEEVLFLMRKSCRNLRKLKNKTSCLTENSSLCELFSERIDTISQLHRELRDVTYAIQNYFAVPILLIIVTEFTSLTLQVHFVHRFLKGCNYTITGWKYLYFCASTSWIFFPVLTLAAISNIGGSTADEANETGNILHKSLNNGTNLGDVETTARFHLLSLNLLKHKMKISILGLFNLDAHMVYSAIASATALLMMMLQLND